MTKLWNYQIIKLWHILMGAHDIMKYESYAIMALWHVQCANMVTFDDTSKRNIVKCTASWSMKLFNHAIMKHEKCFNFQHQIVRSSNRAAWSHEVMKCRNRSDKIFAKHIMECKADAMSFRRRSPRGPGLCDGKARNNTQIVSKWHFATFKERNRNNGMCHVLEHSMTRKPWSSALLELDAEVSAFWR